MPNIPVVHLELLELWRRISELQNTSLKIVSTDNNITGSGVGGDPIILKNDISLNSVTASFYGDGSGLYNIPSGAVDLSNYATLTGVSGTFISGAQLNNILNEYATLSGVSGTFVSQSQLLEYATLVGVSSSFTTPLEVSGAITGALTNYVTGVVTSGNIDGSGSSHNPIILKDNIFLNSVTASSNLVSYGKLENGLEVTASGVASHAEGLETIALGVASHAEGHKTIASASFQHVQGTFNQTSSTALALIGNGIDDTTRSNILEVYNNSINVSGSLYVTNGISGSGENLTNLPTIVDHVLYVAKDGNNDSSGSLTDPFLTVQAALNYASSSYNNFDESVVIEVGPGVYVENITINRQNTYIKSKHNRQEQRATSIFGKTIVDCGTANQKFNQVVGFEGIFFDNNTASPTFAISGSGQYLTYLKYCYIASSNESTDANPVKVFNTCTTASTKLVLENCTLLGQKGGPVLMNVSGGDVKVDSSEFYYSSAVSASNGAGISITGNSLFVADRIIVDIASRVTGSAIINSSSLTLSTPTCYVTNASLNSNIASNAVSTYKGMYLWNVILPTNYTVNANNAGAVVYGNVTTALAPVSYTGILSPSLQLIPLYENHGYIRANNISASNGITGSFSGSGELVNNITASNINNFQNDVRNQLSGGYGIQYMTGTIAVDMNAISVITSSTISHLNVDYIDFNTSSFPSPPTAPTPQLGRIFYNGASGDLSTYLDTNGLYLNNGQQLVQKCINQSGMTIGKGKVVHITGSTGTDTPRITLADWSNDNLSANTLGITMNDSIPGGDSFVIVQGMLTDVDLGHLTSLVNGQILYLSSSGQITNVKPISPKHTVNLGQIVAKADVGQGQNTTIYTSINNGYELSELHDVLTNGKSNGDLLMWNNGSTVWTNTKHLTGSYDLTGSLGITNSLSASQITSSAAQITGSFKGNIIIPSGNGITFDNASIPLSNPSETLSEYEAGTWDPNLNWAGGYYVLGTGSFGKYTVIGDMAFVSCYMVVEEFSYTPLPSTPIYTVLPFQPSGFNPPWTGVIGFRNDIVGAANPNVVKTVVGTTDLIYGNNTTASVNADNIQIGTVLGFTISYKKQ